MGEQPPTSSSTRNRYLFLQSTLDRGGVVHAGALSSFTERHRFELPALEPEPMADPAAALETLTVDGVVCEISQGWAGWTHLRLARRALQTGKKAFFYWPNERAIEVIDRDAYRTHRNIWLAAKTHFDLIEPVRRKWRAAGHTLRLTGQLLANPRLAARALLGGRRNGTATASDHSSGEIVMEEIPADAIAAPMVEVAKLLARAAPVELSPPPASGGETHVEGAGVYLRTDFWAPISSGGSYGHTCYVAKELAATCDRLVAFMAHRYTLLDELGIEQVEIPKPSDVSPEEIIANATGYYWRHLQPALEKLRPKFIYERLCLGNYVGVRLSQELGIPYLVEYNGSEISMQRSFGSSGYKYEELYLQVEAAAFAQATMISVVSEPIREDLIRRGVDPGKILVNPNGADPQAYAPADAAGRAALREELGFEADDRVVGFTGTFGGWHGIDLLAEALPRICGEVPAARFLLIGDGNFKHLIDEKIAQHDLASRVVCTGRIEQKEGARLMRACDLFVSPHNSHMVDSRFFGSPTKVFEYMAVGAGIVASDLEQIGVVLSPALRPADFNRPTPEAGDRRSVLCTPGDLEEFVTAVVGLLENPRICDALGRNARQAIFDHYSWQRHVERLWSFLRGELGAEEPLSFDLASQPPKRRASTGDAYKDEVQEQWDEDPCGSHYVEKAEAHSLEWYEEAEAYRHEDYAPWMPEVMEFDHHSGERVLEIGAGMGTDLSRFASAGSRVVDLDLSRGHLEHARENFALRGLDAGFVHGDAELLPFRDGSFDVVYSNGVIHHTPGTRDVVDEIVRVLRRGGKAIIMVYAENSLHYWRQFVGSIGLNQGMLHEISIGEIMSRNAELSETGARPLVKAYSKARLKKIFDRFNDVEIYQRQLTAPELPRPMRWLPLDVAGKMMGWNLIVKARKS